MKIAFKKALSFEVVYPLTGVLAHLYLGIFVQIVLEPVSESHTLCRPEDLPSLPSLAGCLAGVSGSILQWW